MNLPALKKILGLAGALILAAQASAQTSHDYSIPWSAFGSSGGLSTVGPYTLIGALGHIENAIAIAGPYTMSGGFWTIDNEGAPPAGDLKLSITEARGRLIIMWDGCGLLEEADTVLGPWTSLAGATSPYSVAPLEKTKFYRLRACERE